MISEKEARNIISRTIYEAEGEHGHAFSGGEGLSMFLKIYYTSNGKRYMIREYGNGVIPEKLSEMLTEALPGFEYLDYNLD